MQSFRFFSELLPGYLNCHLLVVVTNTQEFFKQQILAQKLSKRIRLKFNLKKYIYFLAVCLTLKRLDILS